MSATEPLRQFLQATRSAGMRVSAAEGIDAARAVRVVGYADRTVLKDALALVLAKTPDEKALFDECFELYFKRDGFASSEATERDDAALPQGRDAGGGEGMGSGGEGSLGEL